MRFLHNQKIVSEELRDAFSKAFVDLVYVVETSVARKWVEEKEVLPLFYELFALKETPDRAQLKTIQEKLRGTINIGISE